jgi:hypothetical protein
VFACIAKVTANALSQSLLLLLLLLPTSPTDAFITALLQL